MGITVIGIDCATDPRKVGLAKGRWAEGRLAVEELASPAGGVDPPKTIGQWVKSLQPPVLVAIDAPLGWPWPLARALQCHRAGEEIKTDANCLFRRTTDIGVRERLKLTPLDVGADRIARTAHAALEILTEIRAASGHGFALPLDAGPIEHDAAIEVYPAATLKSRGLPWREYKDNQSGAPDKREKARRIREGIIQGVASGDRLSWPEDRRARARESDHVLDAVLCLLAAADFLAGKAVPPAEAELELAAVEGWIWVANRDDAPRGGPPREGAGG